MLGAEFSRCCQKTASLGLCIAIMGWNCKYKRWWCLSHFCLRWLWFRLKYLKYHSLGRSSAENDFYSLVITFFYYYYWWKKSDVSIVVLVHEKTASFKRIWHKKHCRNSLYLHNFSYLLWKPVSHRVLTMLSSVESGLYRMSMIVSTLTLITQ